MNKIISDSRSYDAFSSVDKKRYRIMLQTTFLQSIDNLSRMLILFLNYLN